MDVELPFLSVGNLFTVTAFELAAIVRGAVVCTFIGAVEIWFVICGGFFAPFPTITRRTVFGDEIDRLLPID